MMPASASVSDDLLEVLHRVLRVVRRERASDSRTCAFSSATFSAISTSRSKMPKLASATKIAGDLVLRAPLELGEHALEVELADARQRRRAPVAERAAVRAARFVSMIAIDALGRRRARRRAGEERRRDRVEVGDAVAVARCGRRSSPSRNEMPGDVAQDGAGRADRRRRVPRARRGARRRWPRPRRARRCRRAGCRGSTSRRRPRTSACRAAVDRQAVGLEALHDLRAAPGSARATRCSSRRGRSPAASRGARRSRRLSQSGTTR